MSTQAAASSASRAKVPAGTWAKAEELPLTPETLVALLDNRIAAIRIADFATPAECAAFANAVRAGNMRYYNVAAKIGYIGLAQYEYRWNTPKENYFRDVAAAAADRDWVIKEAGWNPLQRLIDRLQAVYRAPVGIAEEKGLGPYYAGIVRCASGGVALHSDYAPFNSPAYAIKDIDAQLGWNFFAEGLQTGGQTKIYNAPWSPEMAPGEIPQSYGLPYDIVEGAKTCTYDATPGHVVIFNTRNPHEILGGTTVAGRDRISIGSFIGRMPDRSLVMWA